MVVMGEDVFKWPEYKALLLRLNIKIESKRHFTRAITIRAALGERITISHEYTSKDTGSEDRD